MVDPVSGRGNPVPTQRSPRPITRDALDSYPGRAFQPTGHHLGAPDPQGPDLDRHSLGPRHLADRWEGPVSLNRSLPSRRHGLHWMLVIPVIPPLLIPLYNRMEPRLFGMPFFYWYQLACVALMIVVASVVYQVTKGRRPRWPR